MSPDVSGLVQSVIDAVRSVILNAHGATVLTLIAGLILWLAGRKVLKPVVAIAGAGLGGILGSSMAPSMGLGNVHGVPSDAIGLMVGAILGIIAAVAVFRIAVAATAAGTVSLAGLVVAAAVMQFTPGADRRPDNPLLVHQTAAASVTAIPALAQDGPTPPSPAGRVQDFVGNSLDQALAIWEQYPPQDRLILAAAGLIGAGIGLAIGMMMPKKAVAAGTAIIGPALWIPSAISLVETFRLPGHDWVSNATPAAWAGAWFMAALIGYLFQAGGANKPAPARPEPADAE